MRSLVILAFLALTACTNLEAGLGISIGPDGTEVSPSVSGSSGNATISIGG